MSFKYIKFEMMQQISYSEGGYEGGCENLNA